MAFVLTSARQGNTIADSVRAAVVYDTREAGPPGDSLLQDSCLKLLGQAKSGGEGFSIRMLASLCCQRRVCVCVCLFVC